MGSRPGAESSGRERLACSLALPNGRTVDSHHHVSILDRLGTATRCPKRPSRARSRRFSRCCTPFDVRSRGRELCFLCLRGQAQPSAAGARAPSNRRGSTSPGGGAAAPQSAGDYPTSRSPAIRLRRLAPYGSRGGWRRDRVPAAGERPAGSGRRSSARQVRAALDHHGRGGRPDVAGGHGASGPCGSRAASAGWPGTYQSRAYSQTLPAMSNRP